MGHRIWIAIVIFCFTAAALLALVKTNTITAMSGPKTPVVVATSPATPKPTITAKPSPTPTHTTTPSPTPKPSQTTTTPPKTNVTPSSPPTVAPSQVSLWSHGDALWYAPGYPDKTVALTFDDGPGPSTAAIISILEQYRVPATFFNIGYQMADYPGLVLTESKDGFTLGDHTWNHVDLLKLSGSQQASEIGKVVTEYQTLTGQSPTVFRPPNGDYSTTTEAVCTADHMAIWEWTVDPADWQYAGTYSVKDTNLIVHAVETQSVVLNNPVVLMHNPLAGTPDTVAALPIIIKWFEANGYRFVAL